MIGPGIVDRSRSGRTAGKRFLPALIILALGVNWVSAFGEEIPAGPPPASDNVGPPPASDNVGPPPASDNVGPPPASDNVGPPTAAISPKEGRVDRSHAYLDRKINGLVRWFDGFFGDAAESDPAMAKNRLKWSNDLRAEKGNGIRYKPSIRAYLRLPKLQKRARLVIMEDTRDEAVAPIPSDPGTPVVNTPSTANTFRAVHSELRYYAHDTKAGYVFLAAGTRFVWPPETFVRARFLWRRPLAKNTFISPSATPFWQDRVGFGVTPQLDFGHLFPRDHVFLWTNSTTAFEKRPGLLWGTEASLSRILSPVTAIAFSVGANGSTRPTAVADRFNMAANNYRVAFKYRRSIYRPWIFVELIPETNWRRDGGGKRELVPAFTVRLELNSLGSRALLPAPLIVKEPLPIPIEAEGLGGVKPE